MRTASQTLKEGPSDEIALPPENSRIGSSISYSIKPCKVKFEWQDTPVDWMPNQPFVSYFINEINMILPAGEFWFCRLYNKVLPQNYR